MSRSSEARLPTHRIRLRGPWECEPLVRYGDGPVPPPCRMTLPCRWHDGGLPDFAGRVRFTRRFGAPTGITTADRLWLAFGGVSESATVSLNGVRLGERTDEAFEFEVTGRLQARNELVVEVESSGPEGGVWGEVALEIRT